MSIAESEVEAEADLALVAAVAACAEEKLRALLAARRSPADFCDADGVSPLQHAAFKGQAPLVRLLLDHGCDVNFGNHEYRYTALHFGALSGNADVCQLLLDAGVRADAKNSVGRTAAQMAAFVGNYAVVAKINNFIPRRTVDYYACSAPGTDAEPLLPPHIADQFHKFVMEVNLNPVRVALNVQRSPGLVEHLDRVKKVLENMSVKIMTDGGDNDEVISFKLHYLSYLVGEIRDIRQKQLASQTKQHDFVETFCRKLLKPKKEGTAHFRDSFLNEGVRKFPNTQSVIFRQVVCALSQANAPSSLSVIDSAINGQRGFADPLPSCDTCGEEKPAKKCSKCKSVQYCDRECQRLHWFVHKKECNRPENAPLAPAPAVNRDRDLDPAELSRQLQNMMSG